MSAAPTVIDPKALVYPGAVLDEGVRVGPFSIVGANARIGAGTVLGSHVVIDGRTTIGPGNRIFPFAVIGTEPQDLKYRGEDTEVVIGARNVFRESCTVHRGTAGGHGVTRIGDDNLVMAYCHIAHDCVIGSQIVFANVATLGGHVQVGDQAVLGGLAGVHQFCRIGRLAMVSGCAMVAQDVPPFTIVQGDRAELKGLNTVGLKRRGVTGGGLSALKAAYRVLFRTGLLLDTAIAQVRAQVPETPEVRALLEFVMTASRRGIMR